MDITVTDLHGSLFCNGGPVFEHSDKCKISKFYKTKSGASFSIFKYEMVGKIFGVIYLNDKIGHVAISIIYDDIVNTELDSETRKEIEDFLDQFQKPIYPF